MANKKDFTSNINTPASTFIEEEKPIKRTKNKHTSLMMNKQVSDALQKIAAVNRTSVNAIMNQLAESYVANHTEDIERYNSFFGSGVAKK